MRELTQRRKAREYKEKAPPKGKKEGPLCGKEKVN